MEETQRIYGDRDGLTLCESPTEALQGADALVVMTEWKVFRSPDFFEMKDTMNQPVIFDGRNIYDPDFLEKEGFAYYGIGRGRA
jgi:UDPglucose 6-dehydrogenase